MNNQQIRTKNISAHMAVPDRNQTLVGLARAVEHVRAGSGVSY